MMIYVVGGKFYILNFDEDWDDLISKKYLNDLVRMSEWVINCDLDEFVSYKLVKNRSEGELYEFMTLEDAHEYIRMNGSHVQRHKGFISLKSDKEICDMLAKHSPLWASQEK